MDALPSQVTLREVSPRDGLQMEPNFLPTATKQEFIRRLAATGLPHIEITSFVHPRWIPALADSAQIGAAFADMEGTATSALVPNMKGFEGAQAAGMKELVVFMSASESHNKANLNKTIAENLRLFEELIPTIKKEGIKVIGTLSVVCGCPFEGPVPSARVAELVSQLLSFGADSIALGDTIGAGNPLQVSRLLEQVMAQVPPERIIMHFHDTQGMAIANTLTAMQMGISQFDGALGGLGGCPYAPGASGNVPTEHMVYLCEEMGVDTGVNLEALYTVGEWIQDQLGHRLPSSGLKAWLGRREKAQQANAS